MNTLIAVASMLAIFAGAEPQKNGPPFGEAPKVKEEPKPPERTWSVKDGEHVFSVSMKPGIPDPDQLTEVIITANSIPKTPHPKYGNRVPVEGASITVEMTNPAGEVVGRYLAHPMPLSSDKYGLHVTPQHDGIYLLAIRGTTRDGKPLSADVKLPVKVWPLPADLKGGGDAVEKTSTRKPITGTERGP